MNTNLRLRAIVGILLTYGFAIGWSVAAQKYYHNKVASQYLFQSLYPLSAGVAAVLVLMFFGGRFQDLGFRLPKIKYYVSATAVAFVAAFIPFVLNVLINTIYINSEPNIDERLLYFGIPGFMLLAMAEEMFWRGTMYNALKEKYTAFSISIITGILWAIWHFPAIIYTKLLYADRPLWFTVCMFTVISISLSFILVYLRALSKSIFPGVALHGLFNYFVFTIIMPVENGNIDRGVYFTGDIGLFYIIVNIIVALYFCAFASKKIATRSSRRHRSKKVNEESAVVFDNSLPNQSTGA